MFFDSTFLLLIPVLIFAFYAQTKVQSTYRKYLRVPAARGLTGAEAARQLLDAANLRSVPIETTGGQLTDHYDPRKRALFLSEDNYSGRSVASLGVACHEAGHALQHAHAYGPLAMRNAIWPVAGFGSWAAWPIFFLGLIFRSPQMMDIGIIVFTVAAFFTIITLPVEFDASGRALRLLVVKLRPDMPGTLQHILDLYELGIAHCRAKRAADRPEWPIRIPVHRSQDRIPVHRHVAHIERR